MNPPEAGISASPGVPATAGTLPTGMVEVTAEGAAEVDATLEDAIASLTPAAVRHEMGILITQIGTGRFVVRVHPLVPHGLVRRR